MGPHHMNCLGHGGVGLGNGTDYTTSKACPGPMQLQGLAVHGADSPCVHNLSSYIH